MMSHAAGKSGIRKNGGASWRVDYIPEVKVRPLLDTKMCGIMGSVFARAAL